MVGKQLLVAGFVMVFGVVLGFPLIDKAMPCGFLDIGCAGGRFAVYWGLLALGALLIVGGLLVLIFGAKAGGEMLRSGVGAGVSYGRRGGAWAYGKGKTYYERRGGR